MSRMRTIVPTWSHQRTAQDYGKAGDRWPLKLALPAIAGMSVLLWTLIILAVVHV